MQHTIFCIVYHSTIFHASSNSVIGVYICVYIAILESSASRLVVPRASSHASVW